MPDTDVPPAPLQEMQSRPGRTILQVENCPANAALVKQLIARRADLTLMTAINGLEGVEMARTFQPDIILMDMKMPGVNGLDALVILRADPQTAHIPVTMLSSVAFPSEVSKCLQAGAFGYLTKPYKIETLMGAIDAALRHAAQH